MDPVLLWLSIFTGASFVSFLIITFDGIQNKPTPDNIIVYSFLNAICWGLMLLIKVNN